MQLAAKKKKRTKQLNPANSLLRKFSRRHSQDFEKMPDVSKHSPPLLRKDLVGSYMTKTTSAKVGANRHNRESRLDNVPVTGLYTSSPRQSLGFFSVERGSAMNAHHHGVDAPQKNTVQLVAASKCTRIVCQPHNIGPNPFLSKGVRCIITHPGGFSDDMVRQILNGDMSLNLLDLRKTASSNFDMLLKSLPQVPIAGQTPGLGRHKIRIINNQVGLSIIKLASLIKLAESAPIRTGMGQESASNPGMISERVDEPYFPGIGKNKPTPAVWFFWKL